MDKKALLLPALLVAVGAGWLLTTLGIVPGIDWAWTLCLAAVGVLTFVISGFDKLTVVTGPFLILASGLSILRQTGQMRLDVEVPILVMAFGLLLFIARLPAVPMPRWIGQDPKAKP